MSSVARLTAPVRSDPLIWSLGAALVLLFLVPSALVALVPLAMVGAVGLRRPALVAAIIPATFPFHDAVSPGAHLRLDRTALLIIVGVLAAAGHLALKSAPAIVPALGKWSATMLGDETWTRADLRALPNELLAFLRRPGSWAAVTLLALGALSLLTVADPAHRGDSIREFRTTIIFPVTFFLLAAATLERGERRPVPLGPVLLVLDAVVVSGVIIALIGFAQFARGAGIGVEGVHRIKSIFHHPNEVALYLGRIVPVSAAYVLFGRDGWRKWAYLGATAAMLGAIALSFSRGGYIGVAAALLVVTLGSGNRRLLLGYVAAVAVAAVGFALTGAQRFTSLIQPDSGSEGLRLYIWHSAARMLRDHPVWGVGLDQFVSQYAPRYIAPAAWPERFTSHPHNLVLDFYVRLGLLGLAWLVFTLPPFIMRGWRAAMRGRARGERVRFAIALGATGTLVDFTVHGFVDQGYFLHMLAFGFWFALLLVRLASADTLADEGDPAIAEPAGTVPPYARPALGAPFVRTRERSGG